MFIWRIILIVVFVQRALILPVDAYEYCSREVELCRSHVKRHIMCYKEQIEPFAEYQMHYPMTNYFRSWFLFWHNYYRNEVACGRVKGLDGTLPFATRMRQLTWDYELEFLASHHAARCRMQHDQCRNTVRFFTSGQNLGFERNTVGPKKPLERGRKSIYNWFIESKDTPRDIIDKYRKVEDTKIGHFTVLANDRVGKVGCAMTYCKGPDKGFVWYHNYVSCNYDDTNIPGYAVYQSNSKEAQTDCGYFNVGKSTNFSCLCDMTP